MMCIHAKAKAKAKADLNNLVSCSVVWCFVVLCHFVLLYFISFYFGMNGVRGNIPVSAACDLLLF